MKLVVCSDLDDFLDWKKAHGLGEDAVAIGIYGAEGAKTLGELELNEETVVFWTGGCYRSFHFTRIADEIERRTGRRAPWLESPSD